MTESRRELRRNEDEWLALAQDQRDYIGELERRVHDYEGAISWDTTCLNCASLLDQNYQDYMRADRAEAEVARLTTLLATYQMTTERPA